MEIICFRFVYLFIVCSMTLSVTLTIRCQIYRMTDKTFGRKRFWCNELLSYCLLKMCGENHKNILEDKLSSHQNFGGNYEVFLSQVRFR